MVLSADEQVVPLLAEQLVVVLPSGKMVVAASAEERVIPVRAIQMVVDSVSLENVVAVASDDVLDVRMDVVVLTGPSIVGNVIQGDADGDVSSKAVEDGVDAVASGDLVRSVVSSGGERPVLERVVARTAEESIVPEVPAEDVVTAPPAEHIVAALDRHDTVAEEQVVPSLSVQPVITLATVGGGWVVILRTGRETEPKANDVVEGRPLYAHGAQVGMITRDLPS